MLCRTMTMPDGSTVIVCGSGQPRRKCVVCHRYEDQRLGRNPTRVLMKLCDYAVAPGKTCDVPVCSLHAQHVEPDTDYCPQHAQAADAERPAQRAVPDMGSGQGRG